MANPITIKTEQLSKCYRVFSSPRARLAKVSGADAALR